MNPHFCSMRLNTIAALATVTTRDPRRRGDCAILRASFSNSTGIGTLEESGGRARYLDIETLRFGTD